MNSTENSRVSKKQNNLIANALNILAPLAYSLAETAALTRKDVPGSRDLG